MVVRTIQSTQECYSFRLFGTCIITPGTLWIAFVLGTRKWVNMIFLEHVVLVAKKKMSFSLNHCDEEVWGRSNPHRPLTSNHLYPRYLYVVLSSTHSHLEKGLGEPACLIYISFTKSVLYQLLLNHISCVRPLPMVYLTWTWNSLYSASAKPTLCVEGGVGRCTVNWVGRTQVEDNGGICSLG